MSVLEKNPVTDRASQLRDAYRRSNCSITEVLRLFPTLTVRDLLTLAHRQFGRTGMSGREWEILVKTKTNTWCDEISGINPEAAERLKAELAAEFSPQDSTTFSQN